MGWGPSPERNSGFALAISIQTQSLGTAQLKDQLGKLPVVRLKAGKIFSQRQCFRIAAELELRRQLRPQRHGRVPREMVGQAAASRTIRFVPIAALLPTFHTAVPDL